MFDFLYLLTFFPWIDALYVQANLNIEKTFYMCLLRKLFMLQIMCWLLFSSALQQQTKFKRGNIFFGFRDCNQNKTLRQVWERKGKIT